MKYISTRSPIAPVSSMQAIIAGIAPDGGLYLPETQPAFSLDQITALTDLSYPQRALRILQPFLPDYTPADLTTAVLATYSGGRFDHPSVAPLRRLDPDTYILELWHGPTSAFKDMALQILPHLLVSALRGQGEEKEVVILVATSGDTGKAALEGFRDVPSTRVIVFFPEQGVSQVQKLQMLTQAGGNLHVVAVSDANFDDAQNGVKAIFANRELIVSADKRGFRFTSANSINWGRLVPQIAYYFSAYADLLQSGAVSPGAPVNIAVPTGNFGNILAAWYAREMGLPVKTLICASNENRILTDFIRTGVYDTRRAFIKTSSPSMDILISSNLERLLYHLSGQDPALVNRWMAELKSAGAYRIPGEPLTALQAIFWADFCSEGETRQTIRQTWQDHAYLVDTHTAVALNVLSKYRRQTGDSSPTILASTASPFKFNQTVAEAVFGQEAVAGQDEFTLLNRLSQTTGWPIPENLRDLQHKPVRHQTVCHPAEMQAEVSRILGGIA